MSHACMHDMAGVCDVSQAQVMHASDVTGGPHHLVPCHPTREHRRESVCTVQPGPHFTISATHDPFLALGAMLSFFLPGVFHGPCMC